MFVLVSLYALLLIGVLTILCWWRAFGYCPGCNLHREPRCGCDPEKRRKPWRNQKKK